MPISVISRLIPQNNAGFPIVADTDILGGFQVRSTLVDRNSIPTLNRKEGMRVLVIADGNTYQLGPGLTNADWTLAASNETLDQAYGFGNVINITAGSPVHINKSTVDATNAFEINVSAGTGLAASIVGDVTISGLLSLASHKISNVVDPTALQDAATKNYVDTQISALVDDDTSFIKRDGSVTLTADWSVGGHKISNLVDPTAAQDAATKFYVDNATGSSTLETAYTNGNVITVTAGRPVHIDKSVVDATNAFEVNVTGGTGLAASFIGNVSVTGKLTVTGAIDPVSLSLSDPAVGTSLFIDSADGSTAPVSGAAHGRLRYNNGTGKWEVSTQGGAYVALNTGSAPTWASTLAVSNLSGANNPTISSGQKITSDVASDLTIQAPLGQSLRLESNGSTSNGWFVDAAGHLKALTSGTEDIGAVGSNKPNNIFIAGSITASGGGLNSFTGNLKTSGSVILNNEIDFGGGGTSFIHEYADGIISASSNSGSALQLIVGFGQSASNPMLKKSGADLSLRLADDSGDANFLAKNVTLSGNLFLSPTGSSIFIESANSTAAVSGASTGRIRYNNGTGKWEVSTQGGAYTALSTGGSSNASFPVATSQTTSFSFATPSVTYPVDCSGAGDVTGTLPAASSVSNGTPFAAIKTVGPFNAIVAVTGGDTIVGFGSSYTLLDVGESIMVVSDNVSKWYIL